MWFVAHVVDVVHVVHLVRPGFAASPGAKRLIASR
jgi:hypothetical protein